MNPEVNNLKTNTGAVTSTTPKPAPPYPGGDDNDAENVAGDGPGGEETSAIFTRWRHLSFIWKNQKATKSTRKPKKPPPPKALEKPKQPPKAPEKPKLTPISRQVNKMMMENLQQREALEKSKPPPKAPEKPRLTPRRGQTKAKIFESLLQHFGHERKDVAASLEVSVSMFKRKCRQQGITRWQNQMGSSGSVSKPLDQHGERNTSTACETPSHNVQTGMEGELFGQNEVASVFRRDFMGGPIALNTESGLIMVSRPPNQHGERNTSTACGTPSCNVETGMEVEPVGQNPEANVFRQDFMGGPIALNTDGLTFPECSDAVAPSQPMATILNTIPHLIGDSSECAFQVKNQSTQFTANPYPNGLVDPHPQIALTQILSENMEMLEDRRNLLAPQKEPPDNSAYLVRANQSGPIMLNSEKKHTSEGLIGECLTESVLSLDDSTKRKSFPDFDATENKAHLVRAYQSGPVVSLSENKNEGEALKRECITKSILGLGDLQQHCGGRSDAAAKSFRAIYDPGLHTTDSVTWKSFEVLETHRPREQQSNATDTDQERQIQTQMCNELSDARGGRPDAAAKSFRAIYDPGFHTPDSVARNSFEVLETLPARKQPNDGVPLLLPGRLTLEGCVQQEKSPDLPRVMQFNGVERRVTKMPRYLGGLPAQSASSSCGPIGLPDGGHIVLLDALDQSTKNIEHVATADQCSPILSLPEKKMVSKTLNRNCRTMSVIFEEKHQRFVRRCEGVTKSLGAMCISRKHGINQVSMVELIHKQCGIHQWPFLQSAISLPDRGHIVSLSEKKIVRKTLKRKCRSMSVLSLEDHKQHVDRRWEDAAKSHGAKCIRRQLVIHRLSTAKRTHKKHGIHQWPFQRSAISLPDRGHILSLSVKKIVRKTLKRKCRSMSVLSLVDCQQHVDRGWEDAAKNIGVKHICRQLVIHRVSIAKHICRQHGIHHRWPFERDWATEMGYSLGDERPVEVISLSTHAELVPRLQLIYISWLGRFSPRPSALPRGGLIAGPIALSSSEFDATNNIAQRVRQDQRGSGASGSKKKRTREQDPKEKCKSITLDDLLPFQGKKTRKEAAEILGVSVSTLKRTWTECGSGPWKNGGRKKVGRPPDQHGEGNTSTARKALSYNVQPGMEGDLFCQNQEANQFQPEFMEEFLLDLVDGPNVSYMYNENEGEVSSEWQFQLKNQWKVSTSYPNSNGPEVPHPHIASTQTHGENMESLGDRRNSFGSMEEHLLQGRISGTVPPRSDPASSQRIPTIPPTMGSSEDRNNSLAFLDVILDEDVSGSISCTIPSCSEPTPSQPMPIVPRTMGSSDDLRNFLLSQEESFPAGHNSGFINPTIPSCSYPATSLPMSTVPHTTGSSDDFRNLSSVEERHVSESINLTVPSCSDPASSQSMPTIPHPMPTIPQMMPLLTGRQDMRKTRLKATYGNTIIKFPPPSGFSELQEAVSKRLKFKRGSFKLEYKDEEGDSVLIACDEDLRDYLELLTLLGNQVVKLFVLKVPNTMNFCDNCRCDNCRSLKCKRT